LVRPDLSIGDGGANHRLLVLVKIPEKEPTDDHARLNGENLAAEAQESTSPAVKLAEEQSQEAEGNPDGVSAFDAAAVQPSEPTPATADGGQAVEPTISNQAPAQNVSEPSRVTQELDERTKAHEEEIARLKRMIEERDPQFEHTTKVLLRMSRQPSDQASSQGSSRGLLIGGAIVTPVVFLLAGGAFLFYLLSGNGRFAERPAVMLANQPAPAAVASPTIVQTAVKMVQASPPPEPAQVQPSPPVRLAAQPPVPEDDGDAGPPEPSAPRHSALVLDQSLSDKLSSYLHQHRLPYVDALVFANSSGEPRSVTLNGRVRTEKGARDATLKSEDFLSDAQVSIKNRVQVDPEIIPTSAATGSVSAASAGGEPPEAMAGTCQNSCLSDEGHCKTQCAASSAPNLPRSAADIVGFFGQGTSCIDGCQQTREHCVAACGETGPSGGTEPAGGPGQSGSGPPPEGPDQPPG
jgi:hypothetical protein